MYHDLVSYVLVQQDFVWISSSYTPHTHYDQAYFCERDKYKTTSPKLFFGKLHAFYKNIYDLCGKEGGILSPERQKRFREMQQAGAPHKYLGNNSGGAVLRRAATGGFGGFLSQPGRQDPDPMDVDSVGGASASGGASSRIPVGGVSVPVNPFAGGARKGGKPVGAGVPVVNPFAGGARTGGKPVWPGPGTGRQLQL